MSAGEVDDVPEPSGNRRGFGAWVRRLLSAPKNSPAKTLLVPLLVSLVSAVLVAGAAIALRPQYQANLERNRQENVLAAAGLLQAGQSIETLFEQIERRVVDLATGDYATEMDPSTVLEAQRAGDPLVSVAVPPELDLAVIKKRSRYAVVYLLYERERLKMIILPVYGYGLWSTMYGYVALAGDANTIVGLRFYQHGETPGLGAEIDNPQWQRLWQGKQIYGDAGEPVIEVVKGQAARSGEGATYQVDGISGATLTGRGVTNLLQYWFGEHGFGAYLKNLRERGEVMQ